ncbi:Rop family plasmid primer RNA-binding protein, partial [Klebsiella pneumoniae]
MTKQEKTALNMAQFI